MLGIYIFCSVYLLSEYATDFLLPDKENIVLEKDNGTLRWIKAAILTAHITAFATAYFLPEFSIISSMGILVGWFIIGFGLAIRIYAIFSLQKRFHYRIILLKQHELKQTGAYRFIRHPGYLGQLIMFTGVGLVLDHWISVLVMVLVPLPFYLVRIQHEESFLRDRLEGYADYCQHSWRLIPFLW